MGERPYITFARRSSLFSQLLAVFLPVSEWKLQCDFWLALLARLH